MRAPQRLLPLIAGLLLIACSGSDDSVSPEPGLGSTASATIPPRGGSLAVEAENGIAIRVTFPALAVTTPTLVTLRAVDPPAGVKARFMIEPAGWDLNKAVIFKVTYPDGKTPGTHDGIVFTSGESVHIPTTVDKANRTLTATLFHLGFDLPAPVTSSAALAPMSDNEFIDVDELECDFLREALDNQILRAQAFVGAFPPDLATPLIQEYRAALLSCLSPDSIAAASAVLNEYACSNVNSADAQASSAVIESASDLERALGVLVAAEGISEVVGSSCSVQTESIDAVFEKFITYYHDRITAPGFTRSVSDWDSLWRELQTVLRVQALADEFEVFRAQQRIKETLFPALYAIVHEVANTACEEDEENSFLLDLLQGGHPLGHPMTAVPEFPSFTGLDQSEVITEVQTCGSSFTAEAKTSTNDVLGTSVVDAGHEGSVRVTTAGKLVITDNTLGHTCNGIVSRLPMRVRAEVPEHLPVVQLGNLSGSLSVNISTTLNALPAPEEGELPSNFDIIIERDRSVCGIDEPGSIMLARIHVDTQGFVTQMTGTWSGGCPGGPVSGDFTIQILDNGDVTGGFGGSASGDIIGHVNGSGTLDASANGTAGGCNWQGTVRLDNGIVSTSGSWGCPESSCSGEFSGSGSQPTRMSLNIRH